MRWDGAVTFGDYWLGYTGKTDQTSAHAHVAIQLCIGLQLDVTVEFTDHALTAAGVLIGPSVDHCSLPSPGRVAVLYFYPDAPLGRALNALLDERGKASVSADIVDCVRQASSFHEVVASLERKLVTADSFDTRLSNALDLLREDCAGVGAVSRAASAVGLSSPRLRYFATRQMGVPLSQWIIWRKLERACHALAHAASLSDAAMAGGFADQAHLTRMMRRMVGMSPSRVAMVLRNSSDSFKNQQF
ncbi:MAG TPA: AraC family transcriptional regulator [Pseudomonas sp.]|uniref:helix-turn-helix domain-containing protein n=1 Tax=Pseudomonas sp. TaxID=306 RepID=UPI002B46E004|nr:AraC family transcriptional regulator [Pseudomonas sp.]HKS13855.1 AraC family transcriptional regulator [Pseudomonas sp.]